jgi:hypothetical protein
VADRTEVVVEDADDVGSGQNHPELEGDLRGVGAVRQLAPVGSRAGFGGDLLCPPNPYPDTATDWIQATCIAQRALATWLGDADLSGWMERARLNAARGIGDHLADPRMKSALARMFANAGPAVTNLETFQDQPGHAHQEPSRS